MRAPIVAKRLLLRSGAAKPVREMGGAEQRILSRHEALLVHRSAEVAGLLVRDDRAGVDASQ